MLSEVIVPVMDQAGGDLKVARWLKREGESVQAGDPLCEIETSKANVEITSPAAGMLRKILMPEGASVPALTVLAMIGDPGDPLPKIDPLYRVQSSTKPATPTASAPETSVPGNISPGRLGVGASPRAKRLAAEHGIDLAGLTGTGPGGRIVEEDVRRAIEGR